MAKNIINKRHNDTCNFSNDTELWQWMQVLNAKGTITVKIRGL